MINLMARNGDIVGELIKENNGVGEWYLLTEDKKIFQVFWHKEVIDQDLIPEDGNTVVLIANIDTLNFVLTNAVSFKDAKSIKAAIWVPHAG